MKPTVFYTNKNHGRHEFYVKSDAGIYYLFSQSYHRVVHDYFANGVLLNDALKYSNSRRETALNKTKRKLLPYIKYVEREYEIDILEKTKARRKKNSVA